MAAARLALERGDRSQALADLDAAIVLDPEFLAAHQLRERVVGSAYPSPPPAPSVYEPIVAEIEPAPDLAALDPPVFIPEVQLDRIDAFEEPEPFAGIRAPSRPVISRTAIGAVAACALSLALVGWFAIQGSRQGSVQIPTARTVEPDRPAPSISDPTPSAPSPPLPAPVAALPSSARSDESMIPSRSLSSARQREAVVDGTAGSVARSPTSDVPAFDEPRVADGSVESAVGLLEPIQPAAAPVSRQPTASVPVEPTAALPTLAPFESRITAPIAPAAIPVVPAADETVLVRQTLQRYRRAFESLDAESTATVFPSVDRPALARAFAGLRSQTLVFDDCAIEQHEARATAICHGTARYVTRIGSQTPRSEARLWNFVLRKETGGWLIDSARVQR